MFDLVNAIEAYPEFLDWCDGATIHESGEDTIVASIDISFAGLHQRFRTRNSLRPPGDASTGCITMRLVDGPFRRLDGDWTFEPLPGGGCEVRLELDYEFAFSPLKVLMAPVFEEIARSQVGAFVRRAAAVYGAT